MAYIAFQDFDGGTPARHASPAVPVVDPATSGTDRLTDLEWRVVAIARKAGPSSMRRPGPLATAWRAMSSRPNTKLTNPRLEALRRMAVLTWHGGYSVPSHEVHAFLAAGFTAGQYEAIADHIAAARM